MNATEIKNLKAAIEALENDEAMVETNEGTYGPEEAKRAVGSGDPQFGNYRIMECVGTGARRVVGCDPEKAPGRARRFVRELGQKRIELANLRSELARQTVNA